MKKNTFGSQLQKGCARPFVENFVGDFVE